MESATGNLNELVDSSKRLTRRLFTTAENRLELLVVEMQEARERFLHTIILALSVVAFGFFALLALNITIVIVLWDYSHVAVLLTLTGLYAVCAICLYQRLTRLTRDWQMLSATLEQLKKDRECLEKSLA